MIGDPPAWEGLFHPRIEVNVVSDQFPPRQPRGRRGMIFLLAAFFALAAFMYASIMFKIVKYGP